VPDHCRLGVQSLPGSGRRTLYLMAEFREKEAVTAAIRALRADGLSCEDLDLFSDEPVILPPRVIDRPHRLSLASVRGAIVFGARARSISSGGARGEKEMDVRPVAGCGALGCRSPAAAVGEEPAASRSSAVPRKLCGLSRNR